MRDEPCPNCGAAAPRRFCPVCGQRQGEETTKLRFWLRRAVDEFVSLDGRVPRSLRLLLLRPGRLSTEWHRGRRVRYSNPLRLALLGAILMVAVVGVTFPEEPFPTRFLPLVLVAMSPALAGLLGWMERSGSATYLEHTVTVLHLQAVYFLFLSLTVLSTADGLPARGLFEALGGLAFFWTAGYTALALRRIYDDSWPGAIAKTAAFHFAWWFLLGAVLGLVSSAATAV